MAVSEQTAAPPFVALNVTMYALPTLHPAFVLRGNARWRGVLQHDFTRAIALSNGWRPRWKDDNFIYQPTLEEIRTFLRESKGKKVTFDVETDGRHPLICDLRCLGMFNGKRAICIPFLYRDGTTETFIPTGKKKPRVKRRWVEYYPAATRASIVKELQRFADSSKSDRTIFGTQNGQYDRLVMKHRAGVSFPQGDDTILMHHVVASFLPHGLGFLTSMYTDRPYYKSTEDGDAWSSTTDDELWRYCMRDCVCTWLAWEKLAVELHHAPQYPAVYEHDKWQERMCERMKEVGIEIDLSKRDEFREFYSSRATTALDSLRGIVRDLQLAWEPLDELTALLEPDDEDALADMINPGSLPQLRACLHAVGIPLTAKTDTGLLSTAKEFLLEARKSIIDSGAKADDRRIAFLDYLFAWRENSKVLGTFLNPEVLPDGRLHPTYSVHVTPTGRLASKRPNCFDGETEVLTRNGWIPFPEFVRAPEEIAQWDDGIVTFVQPSHVVVEEGPLVHLYNEHVDLRVTPDHRCLLRNRKRGTLRVFQAGDYPEDWQQLNAGIYPGGSGLDVSDNFLRFLCLIQADGSYTQGHGIEITVAKVRKVERVRHLVTTLGIPFRESVRTPPPPGKLESHRFSLLRCEQIDRAKQILGPGKNFGPWLLDLSRHQIGILLDEIMFWDGCFVRQNHYSSSEKSNADWIQVLFVLSGRRANVRTYLPPSGRLNYQVDVSRNGWSMTTNIQRAPLSSPEKVYCVSVPSSYILVRRNGKVMVTGQCQNQPKRIRGMYVAKKGHSLVCGDWDSLELRLTGLLSGERTLIEAFDAFDAGKGPKIHKVNCANIFGLKVEDVVEGSPKYRAAKVFVYAVNYGATANTVFEQVRKDMPDMQFGVFNQCYDNFKKALPRMFDWQKDLVQSGMRNCYLETFLLKRREYFFERAFGEDSPEASAMLNFPLQGGGADVVSTANRRINEEVLPRYQKKCRKDEHVEQLLQVHDELGYEVPDRMVADFITDVNRVATVPPRGTKWRLPVKFEASKRWGGGEEKK